MKFEEKKEILSQILSHSFNNIGQIIVEQNNNYNINGCNFSTNEKAEYKSSDEFADAEEVETCEEDFDTKFKRVIDTMWQEGALKKKYDYAFIKMYMDYVNGNDNIEEKFPCFASTQDFLDYLKSIGCQDLPGKSNFNDYYDNKKIGKDGNIIVKSKIDERLKIVVERFKELMA